MLLWGKTGCACVFLRQFPSTQADPKNDCLGDLVTKVFPVTQQD
jgi:hypothetical protein